MITEQKKESYLWKVNKVAYVVADNIADAEAVYHKHYGNLTVNELRKTNTVYL